MSGQVTWQGQPIGEWVKRTWKPHRTDPEGHRGGTIEVRLQDNGVQRTRLTCECGQRYTGIGMGPADRMTSHRAKMRKEN